MIYLVDEKVEEMERYLEETYPYEFRYARKRRLEEMIDAYEKGSPAAG